MRRIFLSVLLVGGLVITLGVSATSFGMAIMIPNLSPQQKISLAEVIVEGKVSEIEKELVEAKLFPGSTDKVLYHVALIKINENITGAKGLTSVRVGWQKMPDAPIGGPIGGPKGGPIRPIRRPNIISLTKDQEGTFFLQKHHEGDFYILVNNATPIDAKAATYKKDVEEIRKIIKIYDKPSEALDAKEQKDREFAASVLLTKYGTNPANPSNKPVTQEPIPLELSKKILSVMMEMKWVANNGVGVVGGVGNPNPSPNLMTMWYSLRLTEKDGWKPPTFDNKKGQEESQKNMDLAVHAWLKANLDKYQIKRFAVSK